MSQDEAASSWWDWRSFITIFRQVPTVFWASTMGHKGVKTRIKAVFVSASLNYKSQEPFTAGVVLLSDAKVNAGK